MVDDFDIPAPEELDEDFDMPSENPILKIGDEKEIGNQGLKKKLLKEEKAGKHLKMAMKFKYITLGLYLMLPNSILAVTGAILSSSLLDKFVYAGRYVFAKLAISKGMNPYVFVFYRQAFSSLALAPFAFFLEREKPPQLSLNLLCKIFFVSLGRLNLDSYSMNNISATFAATIGNTVLAITFINALCLRMQSISIKHWHGSAKVIGSAVSLLGAMVFIFTKGTSMFGSSHSKTSAPTADYYSKIDW